MQRGGSCRELSGTQPDLIPQKSEERAHDARERVMERSETRPCGGRDDEKTGGSKSDLYYGLLSTSKYRERHPGNLHFALRKLSGL